MSKRGSKWRSTVQERFAKRYEVVPEAGCWLWKGHIRMDGYGTFRIEKKSTRAHRASWMLHVGPIPEGMLVMHICDTVSCVNPAHLMLGTNNDNMADMVKKGRQATGERLRAKLFEDWQIRQIRTDPRVSPLVARDYGTSAEAIGRIRSRRNYKKVI